MNDSSYLLHNNNNFNKNKEINVIQPRKFLIQIILIFFIFTSLITIFFIILFIFDMNLYKYVKHIVSYLDFYQYRFDYITNTLIGYKFLILKLTDDEEYNKFYNEDIYKNFIKNFNGSVENEQKIQTFVFDKTYKLFDTIVHIFDNTESVCVFIVDEIIPNSLNNNNDNKYKKKYSLSNNLLKLSIEVCNNNNSLNNITNVINKPLIEIILFIDNYFREGMNTYKKISKTYENIFSYLNETKFEYIQLLIQFVVRQSVFVISEILKENFSEKIDIYHYISIVFYTTFVLIIGICLVIANLFVCTIFNGKKVRNELLITLIPDEFILHQIEKDEEEKERKRETG